MRRVQVRNYKVLRLPGWLVQLPGTVMVVWLEPGSWWAWGVGPGTRARIAGRLAGGGEAVVGTGLLVPVAGAAGQGERGGVAIVCLTGLACGEQCFPGAVERVSLSAEVAYIPE